MAVTRCVVWMGEQVVLTVEAPREFTPVDGCGVDRSPLTFSGRGLKLVMGTREVDGRRQIHYDAMFSLPYGEALIADAEDSQAAVDRLEAKVRRRRAN